MTDQDEFFLPEEVDRQIERVSQFKEGDRIDAEAMAYLRSFTRPMPSKSRRPWIGSGTALRMQLLLNTMNKSVRKRYICKISKLKTAVWAACAHKVRSAHGALR